MQELNFDNDNNNEQVIRAMARDDYDTLEPDDHTEWPDFFVALDTERDNQDEVRRAVDALGEEEAAAIYEDALADFADEDFDA